jgi:hypothetical protein
MVERKRDCRRVEHFLRFFFFFLFFHAELFELFFRVSLQKNLRDTLTLIRVFYDSSLQDSALHAVIETLRTAHAPVSYEPSFACRNLRLHSHGHDELFPSSQGLVRIAITPEHITKCEIDRDDRDDSDPNYTGSFK